MITIYHNTKCSTSRYVLEAIKAAGHEPVIIEYLKNPLSVEDLRTLAADIGCAPSQLLRKKDPLYKELGLINKSDGDIIETIAQNPKLLERPIVKTASKTIIARPKEQIHDLI